MNNNNNIKSYNFTHISSYVNGTMNPEQMYAFEKAMLNDPFLEDAVEGYRIANISKAKTDLAAIKNVLLPEKDEAKIVPFYQKYKQWLNAAATLIFIASVGAITFAVFNNSSKNKEIAIVTPTTEKPKELSDSNHTINNSPTVITNKPTITASRKLPGIVADKEMIETDTINKHLPKKLINIDSSKKDNYGDAVAAIKAETLEKIPVSSINQLLEGRMAGVSINKKAITPVDSTSIIIAKNDLVNPSNSIKSLISTKIDSTQNANNNLDEVVVIGYGSAKKREMTRNIEKQAINPLDSLMPVGGWQYFSKYINQKIGFIGDTTSNNHLVLIDRNGNTLDDVDIEFLIDNKGTAYNVKIITDIDSTQAKTLANAIKDGPKWISRKKKNKVKILLKNP